MPRLRRGHQGAAAVDRLLKRRIRTRRQRSMHLSRNVDDDVKSRSDCTLAHSRTHMSADLCAYEAPVEAVCSSPERRRPPRRQQRVPRRPQQARNRRRRAQASPRDAALAPRRPRAPASWESVRCPRHRHHRVRAAGRGGVEPFRDAEDSRSVCQPPASSFPQTTSPVIPLTTSAGRARLARLARQLRDEDACLTTARHNCDRFHTTEAQRGDSIVQSLRCTEGQACAASAEQKHCPA